MNRPLSESQKLQHGYDLIDQLTVSRALSIRFLILATGGFFLFLPIFITIYALLTSNTDADINFVFPTQGWLQWIAPLLIIFLTIVLHELIHGVMMSVYGGKPRYGVGLAHFVLPYAYATSSKIFTRNQFLKITLAPLVVISGVGVLLMVLLKIPWLATALAINAAGATVDVWVSTIVWRYPRHVLVEDTKIGLRIYGKPGDRQVPYSHTSLFENFLIGFTGTLVILGFGLSFVLPILLSMLGVESFNIGLADTPWSLYVYQQTLGSGFLSTIRFINVLALSSGVGLIYGFIKSGK